MRWVIENLAAAESGSPASRLLQIGVFEIVPTLCVGTQPGTLRVQQLATGNWQLATSDRQPATGNAARRLAHSHAERGNDQATIKWS
jgi:hypothetical protein